MIDRFSNRLEITGAVFRPGLYAASDTVATVKQLIERAEGFRGDAFTDRTLLTREKADYSLEVMPIDAGAIFRGMAPDVALRNGDVLHIPSIFDLREEYTVTIEGAVKAPGVFVFADNLSVEDMIVRAGGLLEAASTARVDVFRRIKNPSSSAASENRSESFSFAIRDGLMVSGGNEFILQPFDIVSVRTSPGYETQKNVAVNGEVLFPGGYTLVQKEERLSDLIKRAGGTLSSAYLKGASLVRQISDDERARMASTTRLTQLGGPDSLTMASLHLTASYPVGIELDKAIANPGSDYDLVLEEGDQLMVPEYVGTVSISGAVLYPNTVSFNERMTVANYIEQAGGYLRGARRGAKIVVYMNGTVARASAVRGTKITPGCEIVVPYRSHRRNRGSIAEILSMGASATSAAAMAASLINTLR
jgi:protein involved in polysaccharide export with SLBB domain